MPGERVTTRAVRCLPPWVRMDHPDHQRRPMPELPPLAAQGIQRARNRMHAMPNAPNVGTMPRFARVVSTEK